MNASKLLARSEAFRKFQLTFNNPQEHGFTHEVIKSTLKSFRGCTYWCLSDEVGEQGTPHTHLYAAFQNAVEFTTIQQRFHGAHLEGARGSHQENRDYIRKEGKWHDDAKHETNLPETFEESGDLPEERNAKVKASEEILALIEDGASNAEIMRKHPSTMNRLQHVDAARQTLLEERFRNDFRKLQVTYLWGQTGVGKTRSIMELYGYGNVYRVTNYAHPFDSYAQQDIILFDEFRSSLPIADMLKYLDGYPVMLPCRYNDKVACFTTVYVVSNIPMERQYPNIQIEEPETWKAFQRRFSDIFEMLPDSDDLPF
jgi:Putative viral replication protein./RNA helicase.